MVESTRWIYAKERRENVVSYGGLGERITSQGLAADRELTGIVDTRGSTLGSPDRSNARILAGVEQTLHARCVGLKSLERERVRVVESKKEEDGKRARSLKAPVTFELVLRMGKLGRPAPLECTGNARQPRGA